MGYSLFETLGGPLKLVSKDITPHWLHGEYELIPVHYLYTQFTP